MRRSRRCLRLYDRGVRGLGDLTVETLAGVLPMSIRMADGRPLIEMTQADAEFTPFRGERDPDRIGAGDLEPAELHPDLPIAFGSTGTWTLLVPVKSLSTIRKMRPDTSAFPAAMEQMPRASIHPFCLEHEAPEADLSARHFSSPYSETNEDPVTGTASGVMGRVHGDARGELDERARLLDRC